MVRTWVGILLLYGLVIAETRWLCLRLHRVVPGITLRLRTTFRTGRETPPGRPIELIADDLRRLADRRRTAGRGVAFAKLEGLRRAYDQVLGEACACLGIEHLLAVLPLGPELDLERSRVEDALAVAGLRTSEAA